MKNQPISTNPSDYSINCTGDVVVGDVVLFSKAIWSERSSLQNGGERQHFWVMKMYMPWSLG